MQGEIYGGNLANSVQLTDKILKTCQFSLLMELYNNEGKISKSRIPDKPYSAESK